jgi:hypothetical protein
MPRVLWIVLCFSACTAADPDVTPDASMTSPACEDAKTHSDLAWIQSNVFTPACALSGCHRGSAVTAGYLSLDPGQARAQLLNTASTSATSWMRVIPSDAARSYLLVAIGAQMGPTPIDGVMPLGTPALCVEKRDAVRRWIEAGAPP